MSFGIVVTLFSLIHGLSSKQPPLPAFHICCVAASVGAAGCVHAPGRYPARIPVSLLPTLASVGNYPHTTCVPAVVGGVCVCVGGGGSG